jgi:hypothetical protein
MDDAYMRREVSAPTELDGAPGNSGNVAGLTNSHAPKNDSVAMFNRSICSWVRITTTQTPPLRNETRARVCIKAKKKDFFTHHRGEIRHELPG